MTSPLDRAPTMDDVAAAAGVSKMTVSRALRGAVVAAPTRARIMEAVSRLGYVPHAAAGALASRRSGFVAAIVPSMDNSNFAETVAGLEAALRQAGLDLLLGTTLYSSAREEALLHTLMRHRPEGIVLTGGAHSRRVAALLGRSALQRRAAEQGGDAPAVRPAGQHDALGPVAHQRVEQRLLAGAAVERGAQQQVEPCLAERGLKPGDGFGEVGIVHRGNDGGDEAGPPAGQRAGRRVRHIAEPGHRLHDPRPRRRRHHRAAQRPRDGHFRHAGGGGDIVHRRRAIERGGHRASA